MDWVPTGIEKIGEREQCTTPYGNNFNSEYIA